MPEIARVVGAGLVLTVLLAFLRERYPSLAVQLVAAYVVGVFLLVVPFLGRVLDVFVELGRRAEVNAVYLDIALRVVGVAYLTAFGAQICKDSKEEAMAGAIELAGKVIILLLALPVLAGILDSLLALLP
ncbi:MAG: stage III sporulation protein AD [Firmicutes bacterium]|nr:stage III sporulation protein AD [Bacillota bacterium]